ncbi:MAG: CBS domain-containing protein [Pirellulales bacterium]|nr:CBS domain-containing protein [Pirellulales bacterium]
MDRYAGKRDAISEAISNANAGPRGAGILACHIMTPSPTTVGPDVSVLELARLIHARECRHMLVADEHQHLLGVISDRDVIRCFGPSEFPDHQLLEQIRTRDIMSTDVITITPYASLEDAVALMVDHGISCLPVIAGGALIGILTNTDLFLVLQFLLQQTREPNLVPSI